MAWSEVIVDFSEEETINFGKRFETFGENSLYHLKTLSTIVPSSTESVLRNPNFFGKANDNVCLFVVDTVVHVFDTVSFRCLATADFDRNVRNAFVFAQLGLIVAETDGALQFFSYEENKLLFTINVQNGKKAMVLDASIHKSLNRFTALCYNADDSLTLRYFDVKNKEKWQKNKPEVNSIHLSTDMSTIGKIETGQFLNENCFILLGEFGLSVWNRLSDNFSLQNSANFSLYGQRLRFVTVICGGRFLLCIDCCGNVLLYDLCALILIKKWSLPPQVESFVVVSPGNNEVEHQLSAIKFAIVCVSNGKYVFEVRSFEKFGVLYSFVGANVMNIVQRFNGCEDGICVLESAQINQDATYVDEIRIRLIEETIPHEKFNKLLSRGQFREAEKIASLYGLDFQVPIHILLLPKNIIFKAEAKHLLTILNASDYNSTDDSYSNDFFACISKLADGDFVAQLCLNFSGSNCILHERLLRNAVERATSLNKDNFLPKTTKLSTILYRYLTFRLITLDDNSFQAFANRFKLSSMSEIFMDFVEKCDYLKATIIFCRHENDILPDGGCENFLERVFGIVRKSFVSGDCDTLNALVKFLKQYLLPATLQKSLSSVNVVASFLYDFAVSLENVFPSHFPTNALEFAGILRSVYETFTNANSMIMVKDINFSIDLSTVMFCQKKTGADSPVERLSQLCFDLDRFCQLQKYFDKSPLPFENFLTKSDEDLCFLMLETTGTAELLRKTISASLRPYCEQKQLNMDCVLFAYVKHYLQQCLLSPLDSEKRALIVYEYISSADLKCQCILKIMEFAQLPFSTSLERVINELQQIHHPLVGEINRQTEFAKIKTTLNKYDMSMDCLKNSKLSVRHILTQFNNGAVIDDALLIVTKYKCFQAYECFYIRLIHLLDNYKYEAARELLANTPLPEKKHCLERCINRLDVLFESYVEIDGDRLEFYNCLLKSSDCFSSAIVTLNDKYTNQLFTSFRRKMKLSLVMWSKYKMRFHEDRFDETLILNMEVRSFISAEFHAKCEETLYALTKVARLIEVDLFGVMLKLLEHLREENSTCSFRKTILIFELISDLSLGDDQMDVVVGFFLNFAQKLYETCTFESLHADVVDQLGKIGAKFLPVCSGDKLANFLETMAFIYSFRLLDRDLRSMLPNVQFVQFTQSINTYFEFLRNSKLDLTRYQYFECIRFLPWYFCRKFNSSSADLSSLSNSWNSLVEKYLEISLVDVSNSVDFPLIFSILLTLPQVNAQSILDRLLKSNLVEMPKIQETLYAIAAQLCQYWGDSYLLQTSDFYKRSLLIKMAEKKLLNFEVNPTIFIDLFDKYFVRNKYDFDFCRRVYVLYCSASDHFETILTHIVENRLIANSYFPVKNETKKFLVETRCLIDEIVKNKKCRRKFVEYIRRTVGLVNPYCYEILRFCLEFGIVRLDESSSEENYVKYHESMLKFLEFLDNYARRSLLNNEELLFTLRHFSTSQTVQLTNISEVPDFYLTRLPFMCFYAKNQNFQREFWSTIMKNEIDFDNYDLWIRILKKFLPNSCVVASEVLKLVVAKVVKNKNVDENLLEKIEFSLMKTTDYKNSLSVVGYIAENVDNSDLKVKAYEIGISLLNQWRNHVDKAKEKDLLLTIEKFENDFLAVCRVSRTEELLKRNDLLDATSKQLSNQPSRLILHLLKLEGTIVKENFYHIIRKLADINNVDLNKIFLSVLKFWFYESFGKHKAVKEKPLVDGRLCEITDFSMNTIKRIALLFKDTVDSERVFYLLNIIQSKDSEISNVAKIQAIRVLFYLITPEYLDSMLSASTQPLENISVLNSTKLRQLFNNLIYVAWLEKLQVSRFSNLANFQQTDKRDLTLSLCQNLTLNKTLFNAVISLVVDYACNDKEVLLPLIVTADKLKRNSIDITLVLLNCFHKQPHFWSVKEVVNLWVNTAKIVQENLESDSLNVVAVKCPEPLLNNKLNR